MTKVNVRTFLIQNYAKMIRLAKPQVQTCQLLT